MNDDRDTDQRLVLASGERGLQRASDELVRRGLALLTSRQSRTVGFPEDWSLGELSIRDSGEWPQADWTKFGSAQGTITVPPGKDLDLTLGVSNLFTLFSLWMKDPDQLLAVLGEIGSGGLQSLDLRPIDLEQQNSTVLVNPVRLSAWVATLWREMKLSTYLRKAQRDPELSPADESEDDRAYTHRQIQRALERRDLSVFSDA